MVSFAKLFSNQSTDMSVSSRLKPVISDKENAGKYHHRKLFLEMAHEIEVKKNTTAIKLGLPEHLWLSKRIRQRAPIDIKRNVVGNISSCSRR